MSPAAPFCVVLDACHWQILGASLIGSTLRKTVYTSTPIVALLVLLETVIFDEFIVLF